MRKKITALSLLLLSMIGFTANAQETYSWNIEEGATVPGFSSVTLTIEGITNPDGFDNNFSPDSPAVYSADGKRVASFDYQWWSAPDPVDGKVSYELPVNSSDVWPDTKISTPGDYYVWIPEGFFVYDYEFDLDTYKATYRKAPELKLNFTVTASDAYVNTDDITITPAAGDIKVCPEAWVLTFNNPEITSVAINEEAKAQFALSSYRGSDFTMEVGEDGKSVRLVPTESVKEYFADDNYYGRYTVYITKEAFTFNGDATKTNDLLQWKYNIPQKARYDRYSTVPAIAYEGISKITGLKEFEVYFAYRGGEITIPEAAQDGSNQPSLQYFDTNTQAYQICGTFDIEIIPSETIVDSYGWEEQTYPGLRLTLKDEYNVAQFPYGEFKLVIPEAAYIVTAEDPYEEGVVNVMESQAFEASYQYVETPQVSLTPVWSITDGQVFEQFTDCTVTFSGITTVDNDQYDYDAIELYRINGDTEELVGSLNAGYMPEGSWTPVVEPDENGAIRIELREDNYAPYWPLNVDGDYKIKLAKGAFKFEGIATLENEASEISFKIVNPTLVKQATATIDPLPCEISDYPEQFTITFNNDQIQSLTVGTEKVTKYYDENGNYVGPYDVEQPATAQIFSGYYNYGTYVITPDANNVNKLILTPDPTSISEGQKLPNANEIYIRLLNGAIIANAGLESECKNTIIEFGPYSNPLRYETSILSPDAAEVQESLREFTLGLTNEGDDVYEYELDPIIGETPAQLYAYDEVRAEWSLYADLYVYTDEEGNPELDDDGRILFGLPYDPAATSGRYKVVVPQDFITFEDYYSGTIGVKSCEVEYTVKSDLKPYTIEVDPAEGEVPFLDDIKVTFTDSWMSGAYIYAWPAEKAAAAFNAEGEVVAYANMSSDYNWDVTPPTVYHLIDFEPAITEPGEYRVVVASNVICTDYDGIGDNESFSINYTVTGGDPILSVDPADGTTVKDLSKFNFTWAGATSLEVNTDLAEGAKLYNVVEGENVFVSNLTAEASDYKHASLTVADLTAEMPNGEYVLEVPAGLFTVNGKTTEAMTFNYTLAAVILTVTDNGTTPLAKLLLTALNCEEIKQNEDCKEEIVLNYVSGESKQVGTYSVENVVGNTCDLILSADAEILDGDYEIVIPSEYFWCGNDMNKLTKVSMTITSVAGITDDANFDIYSVNGMIIKRNGNKADLKALDPGIYVVNGKKVFVK